MAIRQIRTIGDEILTKPCKPVKEMNERTIELIEDMFETMYESNGCGLAAPQVGVRKRIVVIDVDDGNRKVMRTRDSDATRAANQYVLFNPEILETSGSQTGQEGCLSVPGKCGQVTRAEHVKAKALNENMEEYEIEADGLLARCILHECDHLDGKLYVDLVEGELQDTVGEEEE